MSCAYFAMQPSGTRREIKVVILKAKIVTAEFIDQEFADGGGDVFYVFFPLISDTVLAFPPFLYRSSISSSLNMLFLNRMTGGFLMLRKDEYNMQNYILKAVSEMAPGYMVIYTYIKI